MPRSRIPLILLASVSIAACASTSDVRSLATRTGVFVQSLNSGTAEFIERQNRLNSINEAHLERLAAYGERDRADLQRQRMVWANQGMEERLATQERLEAVTAADIVAAPATHRQTPIRISDGPSAGYTGALAALVDASTVPRPLSAIAELIEFGRQVRSALGELRDAAAQDAEQAANSTEASDDGAAAAVATIPQ